MSDTQDQPKPNATLVAELEMIIKRLCPLYIKFTLENREAGDIWESFDAIFTIGGQKIAAVKVGFHEYTLGPFVGVPIGCLPLGRETLERCIRDDNQKSKTITVEKVQKLAAMVINNLLKARNRLGMELSDAWGLSEEAPSDTIEELDRLVGPRNTFTEDKFVELAEQLFDRLPGIEWDEENLTDALYAEIHEVHGHMKSIIKKNKACGNG